MCEYQNGSGLGMGWANEGGIVFYDGETVKGVMVVGELDVLCYSRREQFEPNPPEGKPTEKCTDGEIKRYYTQLQELGRGVIIRRGSRESIVRCWHGGKVQMVGGG